MLMQDQLIHRLMMVIMMMVLVMIDDDFSLYMFLVQDQAQDACMCNVYVFIKSRMQQRRAIMTHEERLEMVQHHSLMHPIAFHLLYFSVTTPLPPLPCS